MPTLAGNTCAECVAVGGLWQIGMGCGACHIPDAGQCFRSCEELARIERRIEECRKHKSCSVCKDAGCDWFAGSYKNGCTVHYGQFVLFVPSCPVTTAPPLVVTTPTVDPVCKRCGDHEPSGALSYHLSCCNFGGSWFGNCGSPGDSRYKFSWDDGIQACKGSTREITPLRVIVCNLCGRGLCLSVHPLLPPHTHVDTRSE